MVREAHLLAATTIVLLVCCARSYSCNGQTFAATQNIGIGLMPSTGTSVIRNCNYNGGLRFAYADNRFFGNLEIVGGNMQYLHFERIKCDGCNVTVRGVTIVQSSSYGIYFQYSDVTNRGVYIVRNNHITQSDDYHGIYFEDSKLEQGSSLQYISNTVLGSAYSSAVHPIEFWGMSLISSELIFEGNTVTITPSGTDVYCFILTAGTIHASKFILFGNSFTGTSSGEIELIRIDTEFTGDSQFSLTKNTLVATSGSPRRALRMNSFFRTGANVAIADNTITASGTPISFSNGMSTWASGTGTAFVVRCNILNGVAFNPTLVTGQTTPPCAQCSIFSDCITTNTISVSGTAPNSCVCRCKGGQSLFTQPRCASRMITRTQTPSGSQSQSFSPSEDTTYSTSLTLSTTSSGSFSASSSESDQSSQSESQWATSSASISSSLSTSSTLAKSASLSATFSQSSSVGSQSSSRSTSSSKSLTRTLSPSGSPSSSGSATDSTTRSPSVGTPSVSATRSPSDTGSGSISVTQSLSASLSESPSDPSATISPPPTPTRSISASFSGRTHTTTVTRSGSLTLSESLSPESATISPSRSKSLAYIHFVLANTSVEAEAISKADATQRALTNATSTRRPQSATTVASLRTFAGNWSDLLHLVVRLDGDRLDPLAVATRAPSACLNVTVATWADLGPMDVAIIAKYLNSTESPPIALVMHDELTMSIAFAPFAEMSLFGDVPLTVEVRGECLQRRHGVPVFNVSIRRTPIPPPVPATPTASDALTDSTAVATAFVTAAGLGGNPLVATQLSRSSIILGLSKCEPDTNPLEASESPTQARFGESPEAYFYGGAVLNHLVLLTIGCAQLAVAAAYSRIKRVPLIDGLAFARFPSLMLFPVLMLLEPTVMCATVTVIYGTIGFKIMGGISLALCAAFPLAAYMITRHVPRQLTFHRQWDPTTNLASRFFFGNSKWQNNEEGERTNTCQRYRLYFQDYDDKRFHFMILEMWMCIACGVLDGTKTGIGNCGGVLVALLVVFGLFLAAVVALRPYTAPFLLLFAVTLTVVQTVGACFVAVFMFSDKHDAAMMDYAETTTVICMYMLILRSIFDLYPIVKKVYFLVAPGRKYKKTQQQTRGSHFDMSEKLLTLVDELDAVHDDHEAAIFVAELQNDAAESDLDSLLLGPPQGEEEEDLGPVLYGGGREGVDWELLNGGGGENAPLVYVPDLGELDGVLDLAHSDGGLEKLMKLSDAELLLLVAARLRTTVEGLDECDGAAERAVLRIVDAAGLGGKEIANFRGHGIPFAADADREALVTALGSLRGNAAALLLQTRLTSTPNGVDAAAEAQLQAAAAAAAERERKARLAKILDELEDDNNVDEVASAASATSTVSDEQRLFAEDPALLIDPGEVAAGSEAPHDDARNSSPSDADLEVDIDLRSDVTDSLEELLRVEDL